MTEIELQKRFKEFALGIIRFTRTLPHAPENRTIRSQIIDSATAAGANYRAACRGKSSSDFINKLKIVEEEMDETMYWLELMVGVNEDCRQEVAPLYREANELLSITVSSIKTAREKGKPK